jgi:subtilisin family serine protease
VKSSSKSRSRRTSAGSKADNSRSKRISVDPKPVDPWLLWHLQRLRAPGDLPNLPKLNQKIGEAGDQIGVLMQRPEGGWPDDLEIAPYYRMIDFEYATGSFAPKDLLDLNDQVPELRAAYPVNPQMAEVVDDNGESMLSRRGKDALPGHGVVIGFIDNGCAFGHSHFLRRKKPGGPKGTRVLRLWDQSNYSSGNDEPWEEETDLFGYGAELTQHHMDKLIDHYKDACSPRQMYEDIGYPMREVLRGEYRDSDYTHGTHLMDIAAGNGFYSGIAPGADLIFVQLPRYASRENTNQASARHILDGAAYIFAHAERLGKPAVVNISYNAFTGPHDGTSLLERALDRLAEKPGRYIVMSAGNGRRAGCHTSDTLNPGCSVEIKWMLYPGDRTQNFVEIWYPRDGSVEVQVVPPGGGSCCPPLAVGEQSSLRIGHAIVGFAAHAGSFPGTTKKQVLVALHPTAKDNRDEGWSVAPEGLWKIVLSNGSQSSIKYHGWIERDDKGINPNIEQSQFADADEKSTIGGACTGRKPLVVGACNPENKTALYYSAIGPTCDDEAREKPNFYAPGTVRAAQATSATPVSVSGTSVAAAFISGLVAALIRSDEKARTALPSMTTCVDYRKFMAHFPGPVPLQPPRVE